MQLVEAEVEGLAGRDDHRGQQAPPVGVEEAIESPAEGVVAQMGHPLWRQAEGFGRVSSHRLVLAIDRLALDQDRAQEDSRALGVRQPRAPVRSRHEALEVLVEPQAPEEVVDHRQGSQPLGHQRQLARSQAQPLTGSHSGEYSIARL